MLAQTYSDSDSEADSSSDELSVKNTLINNNDDDGEVDDDVDDDLDDETNINNLEKIIKNQTNTIFENDDNEEENDDEDEDNVDNLDNVDLDNDNDENTDDDNDEDNDNDALYLQKFSRDIAKNVVLDFHPECKIHNYDEIKKMSEVTRDSFGIVVDPLHKTISSLTKYEKAKILGQRAKQIESGSLPMIKIPETLIDCHIIAEMELKQKKIPFIIKRPIPGGCVEYWKVSDLENIDF
jgi:DNA-directed RNA polymerase subunit K/omega